MYINDVISQVHHVLPGEYTAEELYRWCDELSALIRLEYNKKYCKIKLRAINGCFFLPKNVDDKSIVRIIAKNKELKKEDFRAFGYRIEYARDGFVIVNINDDTPSEITLIYINEYEPIRLIDKQVTITALEPEDNANKISLSSPAEIRSGDILSITIGETVTEINVINMTVEDGLTVVHYIDDAILETGTDASAKIVRNVTDVTQCPPPYDSMYVDFCTMKIAWYQHNYNVYGYMRKCFDEKLNSYAKHLRRNSAKEPVNKIINYMI